MSLAAGEMSIESQDRRAVRNLRCQELPSPPGVDPLAVFAGASANLRRFLWIQPEFGLTLVGIGTALQWQPSSHRQRFRQAVYFVEEVAQQLALTGEQAEAEPGQVPSGPIICGGFAFDSQPPQSPSRWQAFGAGMLVIPELLGICTQGKHRWLVVAPADLLEQATQRATRSLRSAVGDVASSLPLALLELNNQADDEAYLTAISAALDGIKRGALGKVVPARQVTTRLAGSPGCKATPEFLRRLAAGYPTATTFAIGCGDLTLLGATPELLIRTGSGAAQADALAGSCPRVNDPSQDDALARAMLACPKERHEHDTVVQHVRRAMAATGVQLDPSLSQPQVRALPAIQHLCTPVSGQLPTTPGTILKLAEALHPTPAVAGQPTEAALEFLRRHEPVDRGWFAGPVGWTDLAGNGEFWLALRSGLLDPASNELTLFAGSGVVEESDPAAELRETATKLQAVPAVTDEARLGDSGRQ